MTTSTTNSIKLMPVGSADDATTTDATKDVSTLVFNSRLDSSGESTQDASSVPVSPTSYSPVTSTTSIKSLGEPALECLSYAHLMPKFCLSMIEAGLKTIHPSVEIERHFRGRIFTHFSIGEEVIKVGLRGCSGQKKKYFLKAGNKYYKISFLHNESLPSKINSKPTKAREIQPSQILQSYFKLSGFTEFSVFSPYGEQSSYKTNPGRFLATSGMGRFLAHEGNNLSASCHPVREPSHKEFQKTNKYHAGARIQLAARCLRLLENYPIDRNHPVTLVKEATHYQYMQGTFSKGVSYNASHFSPNNASSSNLVANTKYSEWFNTLKTEGFSQFLTEIEVYGLAAGQKLQLLYLFNLMRTPVPDATSVLSVRQESLRSLANLLSKEDNLRRYGSLFGVETEEDIIRIMAAAKQKPQKGVKSAIDTEIEKLIVKACTKDGMSRVCDFLIHEKMNNSVESPIVKLLHKWYGVPTDYETLSQITIDLAEINTISQNYSNVVPQIIRNIFTYFPAKDSTLYHLMNGTHETDKDTNRIVDRASDDVRIEFIKIMEDVLNKKITSMEGLEKYSRLLTEKLTQYQTRLAELPIHFTKWDTEYRAIVELEKLMQECKTLASADKDFQQEPTKNKFKEFYRVLLRVRQESPETKDLNSIFCMDPSKPGSAYLKSLERSNLVLPEPFFNQLKGFATGSANQATQVNALWSNNPEIEFQCIDSILNHDPSKERKQKLEFYFSQVEGYGKKFKGELMSNIQNLLNLIPEYEQTSYHNVEECLSQLNSAVDHIKKAEILALFEAQIKSSKEASDFLITDFNSHKLKYLTKRLSPEEVVKEFESSINTEKCPICANMNDLVMERDNLIKQVNPTNWRATLTQLVEIKATLGQRLRKYPFLREEINFLKENLMMGFDKNNPEHPNKIHSAYNVVKKLESLADDPTVSMEARHTIVKNFIENHVETEDSFFAYLLEKSAEQNSGAVDLLTKWMDLGLVEIRVSTPG